MECNSTLRRLPGGPNFLTAFAASAVRLLPQVCTCTGREPTFIRHDRLIQLWGYHAPQPAAPVQKMVCVNQSAVSSNKQRALALQM